MNGNHLICKVHFIFERGKNKRCLLNIFLSQMLIEVIRLDKFNIIWILNRLQTSINIILPAGLIKKHDCVLMLLTCIAVKFLLSINNPLARTVTIKVGIRGRVSSSKYEFTLIQNPVKDKYIF